ncbi:LysR family transcriptional regulator [Phytomonospora sp. NPDC050363]|uniref:LysR family transcriptional regulator n=1 Tax=Phytomonospora sp. NPDC050363 TaxID=3155642 RepID=UPI0033F910F5
MEIRELECFLVLSEELHFGRTGERLYVSQGRVSQLLRSLEGRIGARLVERTSRRVRLTPLGERFRESLRPAYDALNNAVCVARAEARGVDGVLRLGFLGGLSERLASTIGRFSARHPDCEVDAVEVPMFDPFGPVRRGEVDAAVVLLPVREADLTLGPVFSREPQRLLVSTRHPLARRQSVSAADLAACDAISVAAPAPDYWSRFPWPPETAWSGPRVRTLQEGLAAVAANRGAMIMCRLTAEYNRRGDVAVVPIEDLPDSTLGLVWRRDGETERVRAFAEALAEAG